MSGEGLVGPARILIVGSGSREHALAWKLAGEPGVESVLVGPGNDAMTTDQRVQRRPDIDPLDGASVVAVARAMTTDLVVIGPEAPLAAGVADACAEAGMAVFGASAAAARIESSKAFCHEVAMATGVPMARARTVRTLVEATAFIDDLERDGRHAVVKADGLAAGKGVTVCASTAEAIEAALIALRDGPVVIEERLDGPEASAIAICDGKRAIALPLARDHKRLGDGDSGPNTGGMGAYSPLPDLPDEAASGLLDRFHRPILTELARRGTPFRGALYAGLILTEDGPVLLEFNARFGDPETQVLLPRLAGPLGPWLLAAARGDLRAGVDRLPMTTDATVGIVLAAAGYPADPRRGDAITGLDDAANAGALVFHAGTRRTDDGTTVTAGGRVLTVVARRSDLAQAAAAADRAADLIAFDGRQRRHDIASAPVGAGAGLAEGAR